MASEIADPTHGWHADDVARAPYRGPAKDVYGRLHHYVKGLLREFQERLKSMTVQFDICGSTVDALVRILKPGIYDRIEVGLFVLPVTISALTGFRQTISPMIIWLASVPRSSCSRRSYDPLPRTHMPLFSLTLLMQYRMRILTVVMQITHVNSLRKSW